MKKRSLLLSVCTFVLLANAYSQNDEIRRSFFSAILPANRNLTAPPQQPHLLLWLQGNDLNRAITMQVAPRQQVTFWRDMRVPGQIRGIIPVERPNSSLAAGMLTSARVTTRTRGSYTAFALSCGARYQNHIRCAYMLHPVPNGVLDNTSYTILAVVRRNSDRGDNYFVMTRGRGCNGHFGGTGCQNNTALHVGWSGGRTMRLGQYGNDVTFDPDRGFSSQRPLSLVMASANSTTKTIALFEPGTGTNTAAIRATHGLLRETNTLFIGGTPWEYGASMPDWRFVGDIFAVLIYRGELPPAELKKAQDYLRNLYGLE